jgi:O-acetyl-ADP-ribose deacetylase (regulator of RNase III)
MIKYTNDSIFNHPINVIQVIPTNKSGVMGAGLAKKFADRYPELLKQHRLHCRAGDYDRARVLMLVATDGGITKPFISLPTKVNHWEKSTKLFVEETLAYCVKLIEAINTAHQHEYAFPMLGCGLGGLEWEVVKPVMEKALRPLPNICWIHEWTGK